MLKSRFLRRSLLTLVVSAAPGIASTSALYAETGAIPSNAALRRANQTTPLRQTPTGRRQGGEGTIQQVQHQPAGQAPQANNAVLQELNKLFQEDGQQMPPMESHKLPYANSPRMENIREKQPSTKKPSLLNRIFGRFRGNSRAPESDASAVDVTTPPPIVMPGNGQAQSFQQPVAGNGQPRSIQSVPPARRNNATRFNAVQTQPQNRAANGQVARPGAAAPANVYRPAGQANPVVAQPRQHVAAPAVQSVPVQARPQVQAQTKPQTQVRPQAQPQVQPATDDGFIDPFQNSVPTPEQEVMLDLESLIENTPEPQTAGPIENERVTTEVATSAAGQQTEQNPFATGEQEAAESEAAAPIANPFTGVQLDMSDEQYFGTPETSAVQPEVIAESPANPFELAEPSAPMEGFGGDLPAIELPAAETAEIEEPASQLIPVESDAPLQPTEELRQPESSSDNLSRDAVEISRNTQKSADVQPEPAGRLSAGNAELIRQQQQRIRREIQKEMIAARADQPGFKGFCPVVLRDQRELLDSSSNHSATFGLRTYQFSSAQAKATFEADPSRYAPAAGGSDVVLLVNTGEEQEGSVEFALWYRDRLYLFRSRQTMALFSQNPQQFANQY